MARAKEPSALRHKQAQAKPGSQDMAPPPRSAWRAWLRGAFALAVLGSVAGVTVTHQTDIAGALHLLGHVDPYRLPVAIGAELLSMMAFARLQRWLLRSGGVNLGLWPMAEVTFAGNALGTTLPGGVAWGRPGPSPSFDAGGPGAPLPCGHYWSRAHCRPSRCSW
jgi:hypothetical protein